MIKYLTMLFLILFSSAAVAHSWYDKDCCGGNDCAEIVEEKTLPEGKITIKTSQGTGTFIPKASKILPTQDPTGKEHACIIKEDFMSSPGFVRCVYRYMGY